MKQFKPFAMAALATLAFAFATFAHAAPSEGKHGYAAVTQAHGVDYLYVTVQPADVAPARVTAAVPESPAVFTSHVMHKRHYQAVTRLALRVEDLPVRPRS